MPILLKFNYFMTGCFVLVSTDGANIGTSCYTNYIEKNINIFMLLKQQEIDTRNLAEMFDGIFFLSF